MINVQHSRTLSGTCGVGLLSGFVDDNYYPRDYLTPSKVAVSGGCGWQIAGFINDSVRKQVYEEFKKRFKIVMQSPVRVNKNSGNKFFFIVYDSKKPRRSKNNPDGNLDLSDNDKFEWPWSITL